MSIYQYQYISIYEARRGDIAEQCMDAMGSAEPGGDRAGSWTSEGKGCGVEEIEAGLENGWLLEPVLLGCLSCPKSGLATGPGCIGSIAAVRGSWRAGSRAGWKGAWPSGDARLTCEGRGLAERGVAETRGAGC